MSEILYRNLSFIDSYNKILSDTIRSVSFYSKSFDINTNLLGEYNLLIDGIPVHSLTGAEQEAEEIFNKQKSNRAGQINVIYGMGLGYLYDVFSQKSNGVNLVFEPDIELLHFVMSSVDFSKEFSKKKTYIVSDIQQFDGIFRSIYGYKTEVSFSALDYYLNKDESFSFVQSKVKQICALVNQNYNFQVNLGSSFLFSTLLSLDKKLKSPLLTDSKDALKNKPALVVSAGPSLAKNINKIKKNRDNFVIFCVGTALKTLLDNDIVPDFLNIIERANTSIHYNFPETKDIMLICEPYTNELVFKKDFKQIFISASSEMESSRWYLEKRNRTDSYFETKGTVAYQALYSAYTLGCNPIILIGQDLAYQNGDCYAKGSRFENLKCFYDDKLDKFVIKPDDHVKFRDSYFHVDYMSTEEKEKQIQEFLKKENDNLESVLGQNGEKLPTSAVYALFVQYISSFGERYHDNVNLFNCSTGGAQIDFFKNMDLEDVVKNYCTVKMDRDTLFKNLTLDNNIDIKYVIDSLKQEKKLINEVVSYTDKGRSYTNKLRKELNNKKQFTSLAEDYFTSAVNIYITILNNCFCKSKMLASYFSNSIAELTHLLKEYRCNKRYDIVNEVLENLVLLYWNKFDGVKELEKFLDICIVELEKDNESCFAKS